VDFVVVGFGLGALAVLLGFALRDVGARWSRVRDGTVLPAGALARRVARGRACRAGGRALAVGGGAACGATLVALLAGVGDRTGATLVLAVLLLAFAALLVWSFAYAHRYHPRPRRRRVPVSATAQGTAATGRATEPVAMAPSDLPATAPVPAVEPLPVSPAATREHDGDVPTAEATDGASASSLSDFASSPAVEDPLAAVVPPGEPVDGSPAEDAAGDDVAAVPWRTAGDDGDAAARGSRTLAHAGKTP